MEDAHANVSVVIGPRSEAGDKSPKNYWRTSRMVEDYVNLVSDVMVPLVAYGRCEFRVERPTLLGAMNSPVRKPILFEKWSPREIAIFEGALALHGKNFHMLQRFIKTKSTKEIIEFYYIWKLTTHGREWKRSFVPDIPDPEY